MRKAIVPVLAFTLLALVPKTSFATQTPRNSGKNLNWAGFLNPASDSIHIKSKPQSNDKSLFSGKIGTVQVSVTSTQLSFNVEAIGLSGTHDLSKDPPVLVQLSSDEKYIFMVLESGKIFIFSLETLSKSLNEFSSEDSNLTATLKDPNLRVFTVGGWFCLVSSIPETSAIWARWSRETKFEYASESLGLSSLDGAEFEVGRDSLTIITSDKRNIVIFAPKQTQ